MKKVRLIVIVFTLFLPWGKSVLGQFELEFTGETQFIEGLKGKKYSNRGMVASEIQQIIHQYQLQGYLECQADTQLRDSIYKVKIIRGNRFNWNLTTAKQSVIQTDRNYRNQQIRKGDFGSVEAQMSRWIGMYENTGHPFASVNFVDLAMEDSVISAKVEIDPGPLILFDSIVIKSPQKLSKHYIRNYIGFRKGEPYSESWVKALRTRLNEIPFISQMRDPEIVFKPGKSIVYMYLEKKKANYFNGVLGVQPNEVTKKVNITGDLEMKLVNALNDGEEIYFNWRKLQNQTQDLSARVTLPYLFNLPLGTSGSLKIYRRDSTFSSVNSSLALIHLLTGSDYIKAFVENSTNNRISSFQPGTGIGNTRAIMYGLGLRKAKFDYLYNPRRGIGITADASAGKKTILGNLLEGEENRSMVQYKFECLAEVFVPTFRQQTVHIAAKGAGIFSDDIYDNEMFRIGGLRTMRGLDEESVFASSYVITTVEYRLLLEENSNLYLFVDQGWYEQKSQTNFTTDTPIGLGAGVNFETGAGIFSVNYALGSQFDNPLLFRAAKISFGFRNLF